MLDLKRLRLLHELAARGTVVAVAEALSYSPSAVSQQLAALEREVGVPLFRRSGRGLRLTPTAQLLAAEAEELLSHVERIESDIRRAQDEVGGTVRIATFQTAMLALLPQTLSHLRADYPELRIEVVQHEPEAGLYETWARGFDFVIAEHYPGHSSTQFSGLDREPLLHDRIQLAVPASFDDVATLADAARHPWVLEPAPAASRHWAEQACRTAGFEPDVCFQTADLQAHIRLVESGNAVGLLPSLLQAERRPGIRLIDLPGRPQRTVFTSARSSSGRNPAIAALREVLTEEAAALNESG